MYKHCNDVVSRGLTFVRYRFDVDINYIEGSNIWLCTNRFKEFKLSV